jgi:hypothetical protein
MPLYWGLVYYWRAALNDPNACSGDPRQQQLYKAVMLLQYMNCFINSWQMANSNIAKLMFHDITKYHTFLQYHHYQVCHEKKNKQH